MAETVVSLQSFSVWCSKFVSIEVCGALQTCTEVSSGVGDGHKEHEISAFQMHSYFWKCLPTIKSELEVTSQKVTACIHTAYFEQSHVSSELEQHREQ